MPTSSERLLTVVLATGNRHKAQEMRAILSDQVRCWTLDDFPGAPVVVEDAPTFTGNATKKAVQLAAWLGGDPSRNPRPRTRSLSVLADDSGLEVDALNGSPGVHSARFAALDRSADVSSARANSPDTANNAKLLRLLENVPLEKRTARFRCVLALTPIISAKTGNHSPVCYANEAELQTQLFEGVCEGRISLAPSGAGGFGYDPLFVPNGYEQSFAELSEAEKNKISHRANALQKMREWLDRK